MKKYAFTHGMLIIIISLEAFENNFNAMKDISAFTALYRWPIYSLRGISKWSQGKHI